MSRRGNPNIVAAALAGVWILLFLFAPLFVMEFPVVSSYLSIGLQVNGCQAIQAYPVILLALLPGILMLVSALLWEKIVGMVLSGVSFVMLLVFLLTCGPSVCIQALLFIPIPSGVSGSSSRHSVPDPVRGDVRGGIPAGRPVFERQPDAGSFKRF